MSKIVFLKSLRELLTPLKRLIDKKAEAPNWNENDSSSNSYIAGRTHYKEEKKVFYLNNVKLTFENITENIYASGISALNGNIGDIFVIVWDEVEYQCKVSSFGGTYVLGNQSILSGMFGEELPNTGEPFLWAFRSNEFGEIYTLDTTESQTVSCYGITTVAHKIPLEYLPEISSVGKEGTGEGAEIFNDYENNVASGRYSHAEGRYTIASGSLSHAEGNSTIASGAYSHAEGSDTHADGADSHAEGYFATTNAAYAHAEGYYTIASSGTQHVQGKFNIEDSANKYAHIVGNGSSSSRKNAHTLDWNGLGWFAGGLKVGGTGQDDVNAVEVALKTDIPSTKGLATESYVDEQFNVLSKQITTPKNSIAFIDQVNGYTYIACMRDGNFVTYCGVKSIEVTTMPTKTEYVAGEYFDPAGMIVTATAYDGTTREIDNYAYPTTYLTDGTTSIEISYIDGGITCSTTIPVTVGAFDPAIVLVDFEYTANEDGTYTITGWKETYNGEASTELIVPNNGLIVV